MSSKRLDEFCEWVHDKRRLCCDEAEFRVTMLTDPCIDSSHSKYSMDAITYNPVCRGWQISMCNSFGLNFHYGNNSHHGAARNENDRDFSKLEEYLQMEIAFFGAFHSSSLDH